MATIKNLIEQLSEIEDKEQSVMFQYFLAEHFSTTQEKFDDAVEALDCAELWDDAHDTVREYISG